jgi:1-acyl-sn-glycerol-3-phosphate acyltransferase
MTPRSSLRASLQIVGGVLRISGATLLDAALGKASREEANRRLGLWARHVVASTQIDLRVEGREHLRDGHPLVIMSNHQSHLDVPCLYASLSPAMRMVAKKELFRFPLFGPAMRQSGFIELDRSDRARAIASLHDAHALLSGGLHVWIAPEGTRSPTGELLPFKKGGFVMALESGAPVLPVGIHGTRDVLPVSALRARLGRRVAVVVGEPIASAGKGRDELMLETRTAIEALIKRARELTS